VAVFDDLRVVETVYLLEPYLAVLDPTEDVASRRRSDIYRQMLSHSFSFLALCRRMPNARDYSTNTPPKRSKHPFGMEIGSPTIPSSGLFSTRRPF
jgi:hypothetical protein